MNEIFQQALVYGREALRFRWHALTGAWVLAVLGWLVVGVLPNQYEATAKVYVDTDSILKPLLKGLAVENATVGERLGAMSRILLSQPNLESVATEVGLLQPDDSPQKKVRTVMQLRENIVIQPGYSLMDSEKAPDIYTIVTRGPDPRTAKDIVEVLLNSFIKEGGGSADGTNIAETFLVQQIKAYEKKLLEAENRVREFKQRHIDVLPQQGASYFQRLQAAQSALSEVELELRQTIDRRNELQRQLEEARKMGVVMGPNGEPIRSPLEERIVAMERRLDELSLRYTERHPDYIETREALEALKRQRETQGSESSAANPVVMQLKLALGEAEANIAAIRVKRDEYAERVTRLKKHIKTLPKVEAELSRLTRNYEVHKEHYNQLLERQEAARLSEDVGKTGEDVKFRIIEPPKVPLFPASPNRPLLNAAVLLVSMGAGLGVALVLAQVRPAVYTREMLENLSGMEVMGSVSMVPTPELQEKQRKEKWLGIIAIALLLLAFVVVTLFQLA